MSLFYWHGRLAINMSTIKCPSAEYPGKLFYFLVFLCNRCPPDIPRISHNCDPTLWRKISVMLMAVSKGSYSEKESLSNPLRGDLLIQPQSGSTCKC